MPAKGTADRECIHKIVKERSLIETKIILLKKWQRT